MNYHAGPGHKLDVLLSELVGEGKSVGRLSNDQLWKFGGALDSQFHEGLPAFRIAPLMDEGANLSC